MITRELPGEEFKETREFFIIVIRDQIVVNFLFDLVNTPFDRFAVPLDVELSSRSLLDI